MTSPSETSLSAFLSDNARNETDEDIISCFVQTEVFWSLFSKSHTILYGSRGAGKTLISRMASFPLLSQSPHPLARKIVVNRDFVGVFVNTDIRFVGSAKSAMWTHNDFSDSHFIWKFNLNCLKSLCLTLDSLLEYRYSNESVRYDLEARIVSKIASMLQINGYPRLHELPQIIAGYESALRESMSSAFLNEQPVHPFLSGPFSVEILEPIQLLIDWFAALCEEYKETKWLLFIDEAEFLTEPQLRIMNSFMRTHTNKIFLKIAVLPFHYRSFETNILASLQEGDDYSVEILDATATFILNSENARPIYDFARALYERRVKYLQRHHALPSDADAGVPLSSLDAVLGASRLLSRKPRNLNPDLALESLKNHVDQLTYDRASKLRQDPAQFDNQIWRKITGPILLRDEFRKTRGGQSAMDVYSGVELLVRCTDGVPRRMINVFHLITKELARSLERPRGAGGYLGKRHHRSMLSYTIQNRVLRDFGARRHANSLSVPVRGPALHHLISAVGGYLRDRLHSGPISTDVTMSFRVEEDCPELIWDIVRSGVAYGHIIPNWRTNRPNSLVKSGTYRLSFCYSPHFNLYPIKGRAQSVLRMLNYVSENLEWSHSSISKGQLDLFTDGDRA